MANTGAVFLWTSNPAHERQRLSRRAAEVKTPAGEWDNALQFTFEPSCADAGLTQMYLVPGLGTVMYETTSFAGPVRCELIYSRAGSTAAEAPQTAFTVGLDAPVYKAAETLDILVRLTLRNTIATRHSDLSERSTVRPANLE